jgi:hypothetical protein
MRLGTEASTAATSGASQDRSTYQRRYSSVTASTRLVASGVSPPLAAEASCFIQMASA